MLLFKYYKHRLVFKFLAGTSRGTLQERDSFMIYVCDTNNSQVYGFGEASPLAKLSIDDIPDFEQKLQNVLQKITIAQPKLNKSNVSEILQKFVSPMLPSLQFALETAFLDLLNGGKKIIFDNPFSSGKQDITINGLIWMGNQDFMLQQIEDKIQKGFSCIKMKIGAINFEEECRILASIRQRFSAQALTLRVDANGAFDKEEALTKLEKLAQYDLHSIEQPIQAGQIEEMAQLCEKTPLKIALDEELIGMRTYQEKKQLLDNIKPHFLILKPTLLGGFQQTKEWISITDSLKDMNWWLTSALESNIALNAIAQFTAEFDNTLPQGLGTGALYHNNIESKLFLEGEKLKFLHDF